MKKRKNSSAPTADDELLVQGADGQWRPPIVSMVNLGCAKNLVDSERILGALVEAGFLIAQDPAVADLALVNTCGFIDEARRETAGVLEELNELKDGGQLKTIVSLGCLVERAADDTSLGRFLNHADARLGFKDYPQLVPIVREMIASQGDAEKYAQATRSYESGPDVSAAKKKVPQSYNDFLVQPRLRIGARHHAYLKIAEGCNNPCTFCAIPRMRGLQGSRPIEDVVAEAHLLAEDGVQEISIIAQDTTSYGQDLYGKHRLADLLRALKDVEGPAWFRLMYAYPKHLDAEMLDVLASDERFCPYIDMPLQHHSDRMLEAMARGVTKAQTMKLLDLIDTKLPQGAIRTTFIAGYPGESDADFQEVLELIHEGRFTHAGVFLYSNEPLTRAAKLADDVPLDVKHARREALMLAQRDVSAAKMEARVGAEVEVMYDGPLSPGQDAPEGAVGVGRTKLEAPEVDGLVFLRNLPLDEVEPGDRLMARVDEAWDYDIAVDCGVC